MEILEHFCQKHGGVSVQRYFQDAGSALHYLHEQKVDLIFLDVEMPGLNGFELLDRLNNRPQIVLTTANAEHAYTAFEYQVTDFLKKPFTYQRFAEAVEKVRISLQQQKVDDAFLFIKVDGKMVRLSCSDILYMESMGDYVRFVTPEKKWITLSTMKELEQKLDAQQFCKVHRSYIVNLNAVEQVRDTHLNIRGTNIPVSKANRQKVMKKFNLK